jgi:hypothetical protein
MSFTFPWFYTKKFTTRFPSKFVEKFQWKNCEVCLPWGRTSYTGPVPILKLMGRTIREGFEGVIFRGWIVDRVESDEGKLQ